MDVAFLVESFRAPPDQMGMGQRAFGVDLPRHPEVTRKFVTAQVQEEICA